MNKRFTFLFVLLNFLMLQSASAILPDGSTAPNWTLTDLDGTSHTLYDVLDAGKMVVIDFSATWCGPCWSYHNNGILDNLYTSHGPNGSNELMIFFIEPDQSTNLACLYGPSGCSGGTWGDWVTGTPYPIINTPNGTVANQYNITYFPTLYAICPNRKVYEASQISYGAWLTWVETCSLDGQGLATDIECYGDGTGSIDLTVTGGYNNKTFSWSNGATTEDLTNLDPGTYSVTITEGHGHSIEVGPWDVNGPSSAVEINTDLLENIDCYGNSNGYIQITASGGTPNYNYNWSNGGSNPTLSNLPAGTYSLIVSDNENCTATESYTITEPEELFLSTIWGDENCDLGDGVIIAQASGGTVTYTYDIGFGPQSSGDFEGLTSGAYWLTVTDNNGCEEYETIFIDNIPAPVADAGPPESIDCVNAQIFLDGSASESGSNIYYLWSTLDGNILSGETTLSPLVDAVGTYELMAYDINSLCFTTSSTFVVGDLTPPLSDAGPPAMLNCTSNTVMLDGSASSSGTGYFYQWVTTDGNIVSGGTTLTPTVDDSGTYTLVVTDGSNSCTAESATSVTANMTPPTADAGSDGMIDCNSVQFILDGSNSSNGSQYTYLWATANGNIVNGDSTTMATVDAAGTYTLLVTDTNNGCTTTSSALVVANSNLPTATINTPGILNCNTLLQMLDGSPSSSGTNITYLWTTTDGNITTGETTHTATVDQGGTYLLTVSDSSNGCVSSTSVVVNQDIVAPTADAGATNQITCSTTSLNLNGSGSSSGTNISYTWTTTDGNITTGSDTPTPTVDEAGTYTILVTDSANGCTSTSSVIITEDTTAPTADAGSNGILNCAINQLSLNGSGSSSGTNIIYLWTTTDGNIVSGENTVNPIVDQAGTYVLTINNTTNGCTATASTMVSTDIVAPNADAGSNEELTCSTSQLNLDASNSSTGTNFTYAWTTTDGNIVSGEDGTNPLVDETGTYTLIVTNTSNGCTAQSAVTVTENTTVPTADSGNSGELNCDINELTLNGNNSSGGSNISYLWTTNNGNIISGETSTTPLVDEAGTYTLTVTNSNNGCTATSSTEVIENLNEPTADAGNTDELNCNMTLINLDGSASSTGPNFDYLWTSTNGNIVSGSTTLSPTIDEAGDYLLVVTNTSNGCTSSSNVVITEASDLDLTLESSNDIDCNGEATGTATVDASGGNGPYTYSWSNGGSGSSESDLEAGTYIATVTDDDGCTETISIELDEPTALEVMVSSTNETSSGGNDGTASANPSGGVSGYEYLWSTGSTSSSISNLSPGLYTVIITDDNGCTSEATVTVSSFQCNVSANINGTNLSCNDSNNGTATASMQGGTGPYTYEWSNGATTATIDNLAAGTYEVIINDDSNCPANATIIITEPTAMSLVLDSSTPVDCAGNATGQATVMAEGGTGTYDYEWSNGANGNTVTDLEAGAYTITATDENDCFETLNIEVTEPLELSAVLTSTDETSAGANDGTATANPSGGVPPYSYNWSNGANTSIVTDLAPGTYTVEISDFNNCTETYTVTINSVACAINVDFNMIEVSCAGSADGMISADVQGGSEPYIYSWSNGASTSTIQDLAAGLYTLSLTDDLGCDTEVSILLSEPNAIQASTTGIPASCNGGTDGYITMVVFGGIAPYTFLWSNGDTNCDLPPGSPPGTYTCIITDSNGCTHSLTEAILEPEILLTNPVATGETASGANDGTATATPTGGTEPYTYLWSNGETTSTITGLTPGTYTVEVVDANNCVSNGTVVVASLDCFVQLSITGTDVNCNGASDGIATVLNILGATGPFTYLWSNGQTTETATNLQAGVYTLEITDGNGCPATAEVIISEPTAIALSATVTQISCNGGADGLIVVTPSGGSGLYTYSWNDGTTNSTCDAPTTGVYTVLITDSNGCTSSSSYTINEPTAIESATVATEAGCNGAETGTIDLSVNGGTGGYSYSWSNGATTEDLTNVAGGNYSCTVTDANDCTHVLSQVVPEASDIAVNITDQTNVQCTNDPTGSATAMANGGSGVLTYSWSNGSTGSVATGLMAGSYTVTASDINGCMSFQTVEITANDNIMPIAIAQATTIFLDATGNATVNPTTVNNGSTDNCEIASMEVDVNNFGCSQTGQNMVNFIVTDGAGNSSSATAMVTVIDNSLPLIGCTNNIVTSECGSSIEYEEPTASDNCGLQSMELLIGLGSGNIFPIGTSVEVYQVTDFSGNSSTCSFTITVEDNAAPEITCPENITVNNCDGLVSYDLPEFTDNCSSAELALISGLGSGSNFPIGTTIETYEATDLSGNSSSCNFTVTVQSDLESEILEIQNPCFGASDGSALAGAAGGSPLYTYLWSDGQTTATAVDLSPGTYTVEVTDATGCTSESTVIVIESLEITSTLDDLVDETGNQANGAIDITVEGGNAPYTYLWSSPNGFSSIEEDISDLVAGVYTCLITDVNGCIFETDPYEVGNITSVDQLTLEQSIQLYPNPTSGQVFLQIDLPQDEAVQVTLYDVTGRMLMETSQETIRSKQYVFDLVEQANGVYLVRIVVDSEVLTKRLVLQKE